MEKVRLIFKGIKDGSIVSLDTELPLELVRDYTAINVRRSANNEFAVVFDPPHFLEEDLVRRVVSIGTYTNLDLDGVYRDENTLEQLQFLGLQWLPDAEGQTKIDQRRKEKHD